MTQKESQHIEFKLVWKDDFLKNVCAFANAEGGTLNIGINDKGEITGVDNSNKLVETLPNIINQKLGIVPAIYIENIEEKRVVKIIVSPSSVPISLNGKYFI